MAVIVAVLLLLVRHENLLWVIYVLSNHVTVYLLEFQLPDQAKKGIANQKRDRERARKGERKKKRYEKNANGAYIEHPCP